MLLYGRGGCGAISSDDTAVVEGKMVASPGGERGERLWGLGSIRVKSQSRRLRREMREGVNLFDGMTNKSHNGDET